MSNKVRSIARDIRRRGSMTRLDECLPDVISEDLSAELHLCPKCRAARDTPVCGEVAAADNELPAPQDRGSLTSDNRTLSNSVATRAALLHARSG